MSKGSAVTVCIAALFFGVAFVGLIVAVAKHPDPTSAPCSSYADYPMKDVPARCLKEFEGR